jgi:copper transport protein
MSPAVAVSHVSLATPGLWLTGGLRGVLLIGLALALGGLSGQGVARNFKGEHPAPLPEPWLLAGCLIGLGASAGLIVTALADPSLAAALAHPLVPGPRSVATLVIASVEFACFAAIAALQRLGRSTGQVQLLLVIVFAESLRAHPEGLLPLAGSLLTICHLLPAVIWVGMLVYTLQAAFAWRHDPSAMQALIRTYANTGAWLFAVVAVTGIASAALLVPIGSLLTTDYGRFLIVKSALVAVVAGLAIAGRAALNRPAAIKLGPARVTRIECATLVAILIVTGLLTVITPPAKTVLGGTPASPSHAASVSGPAHGHGPAARDPELAAGRRIGPEAKWVPGRIQVDPDIVLGLEVG